ncbi:MULTISPECIES: DUF3027 domain-containing protein [unclassified Streptomyces]|uniref:DUF3027 domain-containing protein n=1 Tax=unclassified Streptomyces TaxID=2593676 RepID=UPI002E2D951A|nr:DUF3027 domain-containing protein [Streptomyces sp. NBC_01429]
MSAATTRSRTPDRLCAEAVDLARSAAEEAAAPGVVGEHVSAVADGDRVVTHFFECKDMGYRGWRWAVTVARASRAKVVTLDETVLLPGPDSLLAPEWVPWSERLRPGDMGPGDLLPTEADDLRLEPGYAGGDDEDGAPADTAGATGGASAPLAYPELTEDAEPVDLTDTQTAPGTPGTPGAPEALSGPSAPTAPAVPARGTIAAVAEELGMRRARVLSRYGLHIAADRWDESFGAKTPMAQAAPAPCVSCGFLLPLAGSLRQAFGVCANEFSPADGRVVSLAYGCGGHSEAAVMPKPLRPPPPVLDSIGTDAFPLRPSPDSGSVLTAEDATSEDLGHS